MIFRVDLPFICQRRTSAINITEKTATRNVVARG
jgi:hypothetical protein